MLKYKKSFIKLLILLFFASTFCNCSSPEKQSYKEALRLNKSGKTYEALQILSGIKTDNKKLQSQISLQIKYAHQQLLNNAILLKNKGDYRKALQALDKIVTDDEQLQLQIAALKLQIELIAFTSAKQSGSLVELTLFDMNFPKSRYINDVRNLIEVKVIKQMQNPVTIKRLEGDNPSLNIDEGDSILIHRSFLASKGVFASSSIHDFKLENFKGPDFIEVIPTNVEEGKQGEIVFDYVFTISSRKSLPKTGSYLIKMDLNIFNGKNLIQTIPIQHNLAIKEHKTSGMEEIAINVHLISQFLKHAEEKTQKYANSLFSSLENYNSRTRNQSKTIYDAGTNVMEGIYLYKLMSKLNSMDCSLTHWQQMHIPFTHEYHSKVENILNQCKSEILLSLLQARMYYVYVLLAKEQLEPDLAEKVSKYIQRFDQDKIFSQPEQLIQKFIKTS